MYVTEKCICNQSSLFNSKIKRWFIQLIQAGSSLSKRYITCAQTEMRLSLKKLDNQHSNIF